MLKLSKGGCVVFSVIELWIMTVLVLVFFIVGLVTFRKLDFWTNIIIVVQMIIGVGTTALVCLL